MMKKRILLVLSLILISSGFAAAQTAKRTVTNADLEKFRQKREQAEADYRANYKKLGMPSPEELQKMEAERQVKMAEYSRQVTAENQQTANYYLAQANQLKSQIVNVQAQINYLRGQIGDQSSTVQNPLVITTEQLNSVVIGGGIVIGGGRGGYYPRGVGRGGYYGGNRGNYNRQPNSVVSNAPNVQAAINNAAGAPNPYAGTAQANTGVKVVIGQTNQIRRGGYYNPYGYYGGYGVPYVVNNGSNTHEDLVSRLHYLEQTKAGLFAQLEQVREQARQAGVRID